jgi:molecular chaperone GrpE
MERDPRTENQEHASRRSEDQDAEMADGLGWGEEASEGTENELVTRAELEAERNRAAEYLDQAQRARAEFLNYRRRTEQEMQQVRQTAGERIIQRLLPTLDDLNRAIESMPEEERERPWGQGIVLIQRKLWSTLESEGVRPIDAVGQPFDPSRHEAVSVQEGANGATIVVNEYQRGYTLHDRVIRPSMVVVGSLESGEKGETTDSDA